MLYELRTYYGMPGRLPDVVRRWSGVSKPSPWRCPANADYPLHPVTRSTNPRRSPGKVFPRHAM